MGARTTNMGSDEIVNAPLNIGVLIIGSLLWDDSAKRTEWRGERLLMEQKRKVSVRIRYGRRSKKSRGWTMTFSSSAESGVAYVVPCQHRAASFSQLDEEIRWLAYAEGLIDKITQVTWKRWGAIGILPRVPASDLTQNMTEKWRNRFTEYRHAAFDLGALSAKDEKSPLNGEGLLQINWPSAIARNESAMCDVLIASVNQPTLVDGEYPPPAAIAETCCAGGNVGYFCSNVLNGIETYQDAQIWNGVRGRLDGLFKAKGERNSR